MKTTTNIAVDIGNSAIKLALSTEGTVHQKTLPLVESDWQISMAQWALSLSYDQQVAWHIASVHPQAAQQLMDHLGTNFPAAKVKLLAWCDVPMEANVDEPDRLGIDRLISAYAATLQSEPPLVVVDAGSAITVDMVTKDGKFQGGAILPGLGMQFASLAEGTASLPLLAGTSKKPHYPAKNTEDAIFSGVVTAAIAAIDLLIAKYCNYADINNEDVPVVLTGGDAPFLSPHLQHNHERIENLVCRGILGLQSSN